MKSQTGKRTMPLVGGLRTAVLGATVLAVAGMLSAQGPGDGAPPAAANLKEAPPVAAGKKDDADRKELIATTNVFKIMREGGILMYPIAFCSLVTVAFVFERMVSLRRGRVIPKPFVTRVLQQIGEGKLERDQTLALCDENGSPVAQVFAGAAWKWGRPAVEVEQAILDAGERATHGLRAYLRVFSAVSTIAPLLGLLGTVFGMIQAFNAVAASDALGRPELLANGVAQALLTTALGLVVAIPTLLVYYVFVSKVDRLVSEIDALGEDMVLLISAEAIEERAESRTARPRRNRREAAETAQDSGEDGKEPPAVGRQAAPAAKPATVVREKR